MVGEMDEKTVVNLAAHLVSKMVVQKAELKAVYLV